jgi:flagellar biosynthesis/type III secretory pathway protein FliH
MRDARESEQLRAHLPAWRSHLRTAHEEALRAPHGMRAFAQLMHYIWYVAGDTRFHDFRARLLEHVPHAQETVMTIAEELLNEGREQGLKQGLEQGREIGRQQATASTLRKLLVLKFGAISDGHETRIAAATIFELERYLERFVTAESAATVFED